MLVNVLEFRQGWFHDEPVLPGVQELPEAAAQYLIDLGVAEPADASESDPEPADASESDPEPAAKKGRGK